MHYCDRGLHHFVAGAGEWGDRYCSVCGRVEPEQSIVCSCGGTCGRDKQKLAFLATVRCPPKINEVTLVSMVGLRCPRCGFNWGVIQNYNSNTLSDAGFDINDICDSQAEKDYYTLVSAYSPSRIIIPQLYVEVAKMKGYFIDWYFPDIHLAVEIDGRQHLRQQRHDERRDKALTDMGYKVTRITTDELKWSIQQHRQEMLHRLIANRRTT